MNWRSRLHSLRPNLFLKMSLGFISIVTSLMLVLTGSFYLYFKAEAEKSVMDSLELVSTNNAKNVSSIFDRVEMSVEMLGTGDSGLREQLMLYKGNPETCISAFQGFRLLLGNYVGVALESVTERYHTSFFVSDIYSLSSQLSTPHMNNQALDGNTWLYSDATVKDQDWYVRAVQNPNASQWFTLGDDKSVIYMARYLQYVTVSGIQVQTVTLGVVLIALDVSWIGANVDYSVLTDDAQFLLIDDSGAVLYSQDPAWLERNRSILADIKRQPTGSNTQVLSVRGQSLTVESRHFSKNMSLVTIMPSVDLMKRSSRMLVIFGIVLASCLIAGGLLVIAFSRRITNPILYLARHMRLQAMTPVDIASQRHVDEDVQVLYQSFNELVDRVQASIADMQKAMLREKVSELNVLQAQINPHFLTNSLNSVCCLALTHGETEIADAVSELTSFLRYNISAPDIDVPLQRELEMLKSYIAVQNFLKGETVFYDCDIAVDVETVMVPKMLLQPLVENCIKHGVNNGIVEIVISCQETEDGLCIVVEDNGSGSDIEAINQSLLPGTGEADLAEHGYGIRNVHQRIRMRFGDSYGLHYTATEEGGTAANILLPVIKNGNGRLHHG